MDMNSGVNPSQGGSVRVELSSVSALYREQPPPYTHESTVTIQPIIHQTVIVQAPLKNTPSFYNCPKCRQRILTRVVYLNSRKTHLLAGFVCGFTMWCLLCCLAAIPYITKTCKKAQHYCPKCDTFLGAYSKI